MSELDDIKTRAAELDDANVTIGNALPGYRNLLDRAIAIAEERNYMGLIEQAARNGVEAAEWKAEAFKARAAALALRVALQDFWTYKATKHTVEKVLADTEWLDAHR